MQHCLRPQGLLAHAAQRHEGLPHRRGHRRRELELEVPALRRAEDVAEALRRAVVGALHAHCGAGARLGERAVDVLEQRGHDACVRESGGSMRAGERFMP